MFLHAVRPGPASRSYGLQVAALAGVPQAVIGEARRKLQELESGAAAIVAVPAAGSPAQGQLFGSQDPRREALLGRLAELEPDRLSPREALEILYEISALARTIY